MSDAPTPLPLLTPEQRRAVASYFDRAMRSLRAGSPEQALPFLLECCRIDAANLSYRHALRAAQHEYRSKHPSPGIVRRFAAWRKARRLRRAQQRGKWLDVINLGEALLIIDPKNAEAHRALSGAFEHLGWLDQAVLCLEQARIAVYPREDFDAELARLYERRGSFGQARDLTQVPAAPPDDVQREIDRLREEIEASPTVAANYLQLARLQRRHGAPVAARRWLYRGLNEAGGDFNLALELADMEIDTFRQDLSITEDKLHAQPDNADLIRIRDRLLHEINTREISFFQQQADRYPAELTHRFELGVRLLKAGQFDEALAAFAMARADERLRWRSLVYAAYCHLNRNKWTLAKPLLEEALPLIPETEMMRKEVVSMLAQNAGSPRA